MLTATAMRTGGVTTTPPTIRRIAVVRASAASIVMEPSGQLTLALTTGYHVGPLFIVNKRRAPVIHGGTLGGKRRRQREKRNTPPWGDMRAIRSMYRQAELLTKATGELHVVDHIVPLDGKLVCGLHWHVNMRVIHWLANSKKGWGTWPDMPFEQLELL
jgi:hypothetical protein